MRRITLTHTGLLRDFVEHVERARWDRPRYRAGAAVVCGVVVMEAVAALWMLWVVLAKFGT